MHMAVYNQDSPGDPNSLSGIFLSSIDRDYIHQVTVSSLDAGLRMVREGKSWGVIGIGPNFTDATLQRYLIESNDAIAPSEVQLHMDNSNLEITVNVQQAIYKGYQTMVNDLLLLAGKSLEFASLPVYIEEPVYGERNPSFTNFVAPGPLCTA